MYKCKFFKLYELLPPSLYRDEETGWGLLDEKLKITIDFIRELIGKPLICNTWYINGNCQNRGYRVPESKVGAQFSQHKLGKAADLVCVTVSAEEIRKLMIKNKDKLPYPVRIEKGVNWLHVDVKDMDYKGEKIYFFNA